MLALLGLRQRVLLWWSFRGWSLALPSPQGLCCWKAQALSQAWVSSLPGTVPGTRLVPSKCQWSQQCPGSGCFPAGRA